MAFGWSCISRRQPASSATDAPRSKTAISDTALPLFSGWGAAPRVELRGVASPNSNGQSAAKAEPFRTSGRQSRALLVCLLKFHIGHFSRFQTLHELHYFIVIKPGIFRFNYQKETVACRQREIRRVEDRMIGLRQLVQRQHAQH